MKTSWLRLVAVLAGALGVGCASSREPSSASSLTGAEVKPDGDDASRQTFHIALAESVQEKCEQPSPFFDYDAARTDPVEHPRLRALASCMISGRCRIAASASWAVARARVKCRAIS